jgi:hypothetical protein
MALANRNQDRLKAEAEDRTRVEAELAKSASREGSTGSPSPTERQGEGIRDYGRQGGSIADTGTRTDVPVGVEQIESSRVHNGSPEQAASRQGDPPPPGPASNRGE